MYQVNIDWAFLPQQESFCFLSCVSKHLMCDRWRSFTAIEIIGVEIQHALSKAAQCLLEVGWECAGAGYRYDREIGFHVLSLKTKTALCGLFKKIQQRLP